MKQYQKLMELDGVKLDFDRDALTAIAETTLARKTGAADFVRSWKRS